MTSSSVPPQAPSLHPVPGAGWMVATFQWEPKEKSFSRWNRLQDSKSGNFSFVSWESFCPDHQQNRAQPVQPPEHLRVLFVGFFWSISPQPFYFQPRFLVLKTDT